MQLLYSSPIIIGKEDRIDIPQLHLKNVKVRIDSGAKTSSLHCSFINTTDEKTVTFKVLDDSYEAYTNQTFSLPILRTTMVKSSNGHSEKRYVIRTPIIIFGKTILTEFTLRNRKAMSYPILLGREVLKKGFLIDVNKSNLSFKQKSN